MIKRRSRWILPLLLVLPLSTSFSSDYLFLSSTYIKLTRKVMDQVDPFAGRTFEARSDASAKYSQAVQGLRTQLDEIVRSKVFKKAKPGLVTEVQDKQFADNLNTFKFALRAVATKEGKSPAELFPAYEEWIKTETLVVQAGVEQRLDAFQVRFGPDSEQVNFLELFLGEALLKGTESRPSPWEPILRLDAVQFTTSGPGLTSTFETGMNYYFVNGPTFLHWVGVSNHLGLAASLQYLSDPRLLRFEGRPAFGLAVHLDRKQIGASWDPDQKTVRMSFGYAFQFIPLLM